MDIGITSRFDEVEFADAGDGREEGEGDDVVLAPGGGQRPGHAEHEHRPIVEAGQDLGEGQHGRRR